VVLVVSVVFVVSVELVELVATKHWSVSGSEQLEAAASNFSLFTRTLSWLSDFRLRVPAYQAKQYRVFQHFTAKVVGPGVVRYVE
jgi:hypothetical protein